MDVEIVVCPTVREEDGLALSSANVNLNTEERKAATVLRRALERCRSQINSGERDPARLIAAMRAVIEAEPLARVDYVAITDTERLDPVELIPASSATLVSMAVYIGDTRLTDNIVINGEL
jgi:pantoate--beta-alanine ligase